MPDFSFGERLTGRWLIVGLVALLSIVPASAKGDALDAGVRTGRDKDVQALLKQGRESGEKKDFAGAERLFLQALPSYSIARLLGVSTNSGEGQGKVARHRVPYRAHSVEPFHG